MDKPKSTEWPSEDRIESIGQNGPSGDHYEDDAFRECERRLREAELTADVAACTRCDELASQLKTSRRDYEVMNKFREGAEAERDALKAHVEILASIINSSDLTDRPHVMSELNSLPDTSLARLKAQWQAEALERVPTGAWLTLSDAIECVGDFAAHYRRQAGGDV